MAPLSKEDSDLWERYINRDPKWMAPLRSPRAVSRARILDLHGMTLHQAWKSMLDFIAEHHANGTKEVIVICGTGGSIARELPLWCENARTVRRAVPIVDSHGQHGAFRIILIKPA